MSAQVAQSIMNKGLSKPNLYVFKIPNNENTHKFDAQKYLKYFCKSVSLPELSQDVIVSNGHFRQGIVTQQPTGYKYGKPLEITIVERSDYHSYQELRNWFSKSGNYYNDDYFGQRMSYKKSYVADIELKKLELPYFNDRKQERKDIKEIDHFEVAWTAKFVNAYITSLSQITYSSDARDAMVEYSAEFYFDNYVMEFER